jgi:hypothetical protein
MSDPNVPGQQPPPPQQPPQQPAPPQQPPPQQPPPQPAPPQPAPPVAQAPYPPPQPGVPPQGYAAPGAPTAPPGSFGAYPTQPPPPQPSNKLKPIVVIGVLVAVMAVVGGGLALFGSSQDSEERSEVVPTGLPVLDPSQGPQPSEPIEPTPTPGPDPDPVVTTTTEAPEPEPDPDPDPGPGPGPDPGPGPSGDAVEVGGGVSVVPAPKWKVAAQEAGFVQLNAPSGDGNLYVSVYDESIGSEPIGVLTNYVEAMVVPYVSELQTTEPEALTGVGGNIVGAAKVEYAGVQAGQSGNIPVEGLILSFVRQDGTVVVYEEFNIAGAYEGLQPDYKSMLESVLATL